jgi:hypothetical protein
LQDLILSPTHAQEVICGLWCEPMPGGEISICCCLQGSCTQDLKRTACVLLGAIACFELRAGTDVPPTP